MRRIRLAIIGFLAAAPFVFLLGMGWYALWERGWSFWAWWPMTASLALAYVLGLYWYRKYRLIQPVDITPPAVGTNLDEQAWKLVEARAAAANTLVTEQLTDPQVYLTTAQELAAELAGHYHPRASDPVGGLTIPELLAVVELAAHDLSKLVNTYVPAGHLLTLDSLRRARKAGEVYQKASNLYWLVWMAFNPLKAGAQFMASQLGITRPWQLIQQNLLIWFFTAYVQRLGHYLIEVYSGRLKVGVQRYRELVQPPPAGAAEPDKAPTVTITLLGQTKVGKSSLINALLGEQRAHTDVVPATDAVTRYELKLEDVPVRLVLFDTVGYGHEGPRKDRVPETLDAARRSELLVLVLHARNPAREADARMLREIAAWYAERPDLKPPPILAVLTHIDLLSPVMEWSPPYNWEEPTRPKERQIAEAVAAVPEQLGDELAYVAPVCTAEGKVYGVEEWCLPALASLLDEARGVAVVRALRGEADLGKVRRVFQQLAAAGGGALRLWRERRRKD